MVDFNVNGKKYSATEIFNLLDQKDGKQNQTIDKSIWNQLANIQIGENKNLGNEIKSTIDKSNAIRSINVYLGRIADNDKAKEDLAELLGLSISKEMPKTPPFTPEIQGVPQTSEKFKSKKEDFKTQQTIKPQQNQKMQQTRIKADLGTLEESVFTQPWQRTAKMLSQPSPFVKSDMFIKKEQYKKVLVDVNTNETATEQTTTKEILDNGYVKITVDASKYNYSKERHVSFTYNRQELEKFIINNESNDAPHFSKINEIRQKAENERTISEQNLLNEFETMMDAVIAAAEEYGVDPKQILTIIHQECKFNGCSEKVLKTDHGTGYMQITGAPIRDYLGVDCNKTKNSKYGYEMNLLLKSRGFDPDKCKTIADREKMASDILKYLKKGGDPDFNIRMGTLILRLQLDRANGNFGTAARNYNGNTSVKNGVQMRDIYKAQTSKYYQKLDPQPVEYSVKTIKK